MNKLAKLKPLHYNLSLQPDYLNYSCFLGKVEILCEIQEYGDHFELNVNPSTIIILSSSVSSYSTKDDTITQENIRIENFEILETNSNLRFNLAENLNSKFKGLKISIFYCGKISRDMKGFYCSQIRQSSDPQNNDKNRSNDLYKDISEKLLERYPLIHKRVLSTQFEAIDARSAFPCWDRPDCKATFSLNILCHSELIGKLTFLSNCKVRKIEEKVKPLILQSNLSLIEKRKKDIEKVIKIDFEKFCSLFLNTKGDENRNEKWSLVRFEKTVKMSTYLLAWAIGIFEEKSLLCNSSQSNTKRLKIQSNSNFEIKEEETKVLTKSFEGKISAFCVRGNVEKLEFALNIAKEALLGLERFFLVPFPLPALKLLAVPEFSAGAMENWGLITFRESALFVDESTSIRQRRRVVSVVAHEVAHMWFGNLVTMKDWSDLWLNEGFATFIMYEESARVLKNFDVRNDLLAGRTKSAYEDDELVCSEAVKPFAFYDCNSCNNIGEGNKKGKEMVRQLFDSIRYAKGGTVLRMLSNYVGYEELGKGLQKYLKKFAYSNATCDDLFEVLDEELGKDVSGIMGGFIKKAGVPLLSLSLSDKNGSDVEIELRQSRFVAQETLIKRIGDFSLHDSNSESNGSKREEGRKEWKIPVFLETGNLGPLKPFVFEEVFSKVSLSTHILTNCSEKGFDYLIGNSKESGYYITRYSIELIKAFIKANTNNKEREKTASHLKFLRDFIILTKAGVYSLNLFFEVLECFKQTEDHNVLSEVLCFFKYLNLFELNSSYKSILEKKFKEFLEKNEKFESYKEEVFGIVEDPSNGLLVFPSLSFTLYKESEELVKRERKELFLFNFLSAYSFAFSDGTSKNILKNFTLSLMEQKTKAFNKTNSFKLFVYKTLINENGFLEKLFERFISEEISLEEKMKILISFGFVESEEKVNKVFDFILSENVKNQNKHFAICSLMQNSPKRKFFFNRMREKKEKILSIYKEGFLAARIVEATAVFSDSESLKIMEELFGGNKNISVALKRAVEKVKNNIMFKRVLDLEEKGEL